jgi:hypothetical protein
VVPAVAFPPGQPITISGSALDLFGRAFAISLSGAPLTTSAVVSDLDFTTAPPGGAIVGVDGWTDAGRYALNSSEPGPWFALIALPARGTAERLRVTAADWTACDGFTFSIIAADGARSDLPALDELAARPWTADAALPAGDPLYLAVAADAPGYLPQTHNDICSLYLDRIAFE